MEDHNTATFPSKKCVRQGGVGCSCCALESGVWTVGKVSLFFSLLFKTMNQKSTVVGTPGADVALSPGAPLPLLPSLSRRGLPFFLAHLFEALIPSHSSPRCHLCFDLGPLTDWPLYPFPIFKLSFSSSFPPLFLCPLSPPIRPGTTTWRPTSNGRWPRHEPRAWRHSNRSEPRLMTRPSGSTCARADGCCAVMYVCVPAHL